MSHPGIIRESCRPPAQPSLTQSMKKNTGAQPFTELAEQIEIDWLSSGGAIGFEYPGDLAVTGQPYVELVHVTPRLDIDMAILGGTGLFQSYARRKMGTLYWHSVPTIERVRVGRYWGYRATMRLLISDNPVVQRLQAEAEAARP